MIELKHIYAIPDSDLVDYLRTVKFSSLTKAATLYINHRLEQLGYTIDYGCCGNNVIKEIKK